MTDDNDSFLSNRLPYLAAEVLLSHMSIFELKALRQVSKNTKAWIELPEILSEFQVVINGDARMVEVISSNSDVPYSNFFFSKKYKCVSDSDIRKFLTKYADIIKTLEFNWSQAKMQHELRILTNCPNLESLKSIQLNLETLLPGVLTKNLLENWTNLRHFHVQRFGGGPESPLTEMEFFKQILFNCLELKTLTIPQFSYDYHPVNGFDYMESYMTHVVSPLLKYIYSRRLQSITVPYYGITEDVFLLLATACLETNTVILNVPFTFLKSLTEEQLPLLDIIGSLDGATDAIIRASLERVQNICFVNPSFHIDNHLYQVPPFTNLVNVEIDFKFSKKNQKSMELFVHRLAKIRRPTVKSLKIAYQPGPPVVFPLNISPSDLVSSFVNLRILHIEDWEGSDKHFLQIWERASNVADLRILNCRNLTDQGILGENYSEAAILKLKYLRRLSIINNLYVDSGEVNISEMSFIHAFRHMRLKSFHFFDGNLLLTEKSIALTAMEALRNGVFGSTIEDFILQETDLENCDMVLKKKLGSGRRDNKKKYNDNRYFFRTSPLGWGSASAGYTTSHQQNNANCTIM